MEATVGESVVLTTGDHSTCAAMWVLQPGPAGLVSFPGIQRAHPPSLAPPLLAGIRPLANHTGGAAGPLSSTGS